MTSISLPLRWRRLLASVFVLWQLLAITAWLLPHSALRRALMPAVRPYMLFTGCAQDWSMFAPDPRRMDIYLTAELTYRDGSHKTWSFPRMHDLGYLQR